MSLAEWSFPHEMARSEFEENFVKVTVHNRKDMVKLGRIYYAIDPVFRKPKMLGVYCVFPCLRPNSTLVVSGDKSSIKQNYELFCRDGQDYDEWKNGFDSVITKLIGMEQMYVHKKQKLAEFKWK